MVETWLSVCEIDGVIYLDPAEENSVDAAVTHYLDTGRDSVLHLDRATGYEYHTRASNILSWFVSSPESRRAEMLFGKDAHEESTALKTELGVWDEP
jgi:hypothetical protein